MNPLLPVEYSKHSYPVLVLTSSSCINPALYNCERVLTHIAWSFPGFIMQCSEGLS